MSVQFEVTRLSENSSAVGLSARCFCGGGWGALPGAVRVLTTLLEEPRAPLPASECSSPLLSSCVTLGKLLKLCLFDPENGEENMPT